MFRENGKGATKFLTCMSEPERQQWMREAHSADKKKLIHMMQTANQRYCEREKRFIFGGVFKPLIVWEKLGYDAAVIAKDSLPEDVRGDRMWGKVYRVPELTVEDAGREGNRGERTETLPSKRRRLKALIKDVCEPDASGAGEVGASNDSNESSETSSSSASIPTRRRLRGARAMAKKREREREEMAMARGIAKKEKKRVAKEKRQEIEAMKREKAAKKEEEKQRRLPLQKKPRPRRIKSVRRSARLRRRRLQQRQRRLRSMQLSTTSRACFGNLGRISCLRRPSFRCLSLIHI